MVTLKACPGDITVQLQNFVQLTSRYQKIALWPVHTKPYIRVALSSALAAPEKSDAER